MTRREELAAQFLAGMLADGDRNRALPNTCVSIAFDYADAFLAACEPEQKPEREPDAVLVLEDDHVFKTADGSRWGPMCDRLLAGRDRARLKVFVEEVKP